MSLRELAAKQQPFKPCKFMRVYMQLTDEDDRNYVNEQMTGNGEMKALARLLSDHVEKISDQSIYRHLVGPCSCAPDAPLRGVRS